MRSCKLLSPATQRYLREALKEDFGPYGDVTSQLLIPADAKGRAVVIAREPGVFAGCFAADFLVKSADPLIQIKFRVKDGQKFSKNQTLLEIKGRVRSLLAVERTLLNLLGHLAGVATLTRAFVEKLKPYGVRVLDTRKTTPLWRELEKMAVRAGGGENHRMGLYDEIFVKENHRAYGNLGKLGKKAGCFVMEVRNLKELEEALALKPRVILFDNFKPEALRGAVKKARLVNPGILLEASGGIHLGNAAKFAAAGIDQISVGALTHSVKSIDLSLLSNTV